MFTPNQYREKAVEYGKLMKIANGPNERREFQVLEQSFTVLADNAQWLDDNHDKTVRRTDDVLLADQPRTVTSPT